MCDASQTICSSWCCFFTRGLHSFSLFCAIVVGSVFVSCFAVGLRMWGGAQTSAQNLSMQGTAVAVAVVVVAAAAAAAAVMLQVCLSLRLQRLLACFVDSSSCFLVSKCWSPCCVL